MDHLIGNDAPEIDSANIRLAIKLKFQVVSYVRTQTSHPLICATQQELLFCYSFKMEHVLDRVTTCQRALFLGLGLRKVLGTV